MKTRRTSKASSSVNTESSQQLTIRCTPEEAAVLDSAYKLYVSRTPNAGSKSKYLKSLMLSSLNLDEPEQTDEKEYLISDEKVKLVQALSDELNILINNLEDQNQTMVSLSSVVRYLKSLTGYKYLPESELVSSPIELLNSMRS